MRIFTIRFAKNGPKEYKIYDHEEDAKANGITDIKIWGQGTFDDFEAGDWIRSDDGYVIQILGKTCFDAGKAKKTIFKFCNSSVNCYYSTRKERFVFGRMFAFMACQDRTRATTKWIVDRCTNRTKKMEFVELVLAGMPPYWAAKKVAKKTLSKQGIYNYMTDMLRDKDVRENLQAEIQKTFGAKITGRISEDRYIDEIEQFLDKTRKGSLSHLAGLKFIGELAGYVKPVERARRDATESALEGDYEVMEPPRIGE